MHDTHQLFSAEEAFVRLGQSRVLGCLVVVSAESAVRLFVEDGFVIHAVAEKCKGENALQEALAMTDSSYVWIPQAETKDKTIRVNITAYSIKHSIARDTKVGATGKVNLTKVDSKRATAPVQDRFGSESYYLQADGHAPGELRLKKATNIIGRDPSCDLVLSNGQVSRRHCLLEIQAKGIYIRDLGSTNGIQVNGRPMQEGFITCNDEINFGSYKFKLQKDLVPA